MLPFETERLNGSDASELYTLTSLPRFGAQAAERRRRLISTVLLTIGVVISIILSIIALVLVGNVSRKHDTQFSGSGTGNGASSPPSPSPAFVPTRKIAFGSCTSYDLRPQTLWTDVSKVADGWLLAPNMETGGSRGKACLTASAPGPRPDRHHAGPHPTSHSSHSWSYEQLRTYLVLQRNRCWHGPSGVPRVTPNTHSSLPHPAPFFFSSGMYQSKTRAVTL